MQDCDDRHLTYLFAFWGLFCRRLLSFFVLALFRGHGERLQSASRRRQVTQMEEEKRFVDP